MPTLILAILAFIAAHVIPAYRPLREKLIAVLGRRGYLAAYMALSLALLAWVAIAYTQAPYVEVWTQTPWMRWVPNLVMPVAFILLAASLILPNPFSLAVRTKGFDPKRPGLLAVTRHPLMWAVSLWAGAHMAPNGDVASLMLFGLLCALGLAGPIILDAKYKKRLGQEAWERLTRRTSSVPFVALLRGRADWVFDGRDAVTAALGILFYVGFLHVHVYLIGVSPLP
ncbi:NnrU family protein [Varunaivibrio sulfuroxidans]|uniref:Putative membrane protein n=1 Tax=Varunaivibrio sulfuroxidans TaxID=1773489 RepID=A0A4V2UP70_9PROT|nr:NnrU family protein [Varunaivibrio sulfuroxidans]TCS64761.1 putative membrane protein [Varunaivibrio sulfuroxidans]WES29934.1 NnrU family protein [Varunaivibrio sulfuroxidans]